VGRGRRCLSCGPLARPAAIGPCHGWRRANRVAEKPGATASARAGLGATAAGALPPAAGARIRSHGLLLAWRGLR
jgi:hypothetical protein